MAQHIFGWAYKAGTPGCLECHITKLAERVRSERPHDVCNLPSLPIIPTTEGSTGRMRTSL
eukprot:4159562-Prymnesium_polylepis.1